MGGYEAWRAAEAVRQSGIKLVQHGKRHDIYYSPKTGKKFPVPRHTKEIAAGTAKSIMKDGGLE